MANRTKRKSKAVEKAPKTRTLKFNRRKYADLLAEALPTAITNDEELERFTVIVDKLAVKKDLSLEESRLLDLLSTLIEVYEDERYPIPDAPPHVMIQGFMQDRGLRNKDLEAILGSSGVTSEVIRGKRKLSKQQVKKLASFFGVSPELFVSLD
ncbi:MAG: helix-turn-helix domain-containing protein [Blastocatellia bacterium]